MRFDKGKLEIGSVPIRYSCFSHPLDETFFVSDSGSAIKLPSGNKTYFYGHAGSTHKDEAIKRSAYEVLERMLAYGPCFPKSILELDFFGKPLFKPDGDKKIFDASQVLLSRGSKCVSASGLGFHTVKELAIEHAVYETMERDILCRIWYQDLSVFQFKNEE